MSFPRAGRYAGVLLAITTGALVLAATGSAHAHVSPPVALATEGQVFTLAVPTEKEDAATTAVELTPPSGFAIDSFAPSPGWTRNVQSSGAGEETTIRKVTWSGGKVPHEEDAMFQFLASAEKAQTYTFKVRQTYSDGTVVDWSGPESSDSPAPTIRAKSSLGGGGNTALTVVALVLAAIGVVVGAAALVTRSGGRAVA
jgi:uncharacterized protein YcnI